MVFTIGHSNHSLERFIGLLKQHGVQVLVDTRSYPASKHACHFDLANLKLAIKDAGMRFVYLGRQLGGRPPNKAYYDDEGRVLYDRLAQSDAFLAGISRLERGLRQYRVALMCSEENPAFCHRRLLIGRVLGERGIRLLHIRGDGTVESEAELQATLEDGKQLGLFAETEASTWKSTLSVSRRKQHPCSLKR